MVLLGGRSSVWAWGRAYSHTFPGDTSALEFSPGTSVATAAFCSSSCSTWSSCKWGRCQPHVLGPRTLSLRVSEEPRADGLSSERVAETEVAVNGP